MDSDITKMRISVDKNYKFLIPKFLEKENDITKLFLMRLQVYRDYSRGLLASDDSRIERISGIVYTSYMNDILSYKLALTCEITEVFKLNNTDSFIAKNESYINSIMLSANEKLVSYSTLDDRLFCYYIWGHTFGTHHVTGDYSFSIDNQFYLEGIHTDAFNQKLSMFHEQRKLIVILNIECNVSYPIKLGTIKSNWNKINAHGSIVKLNEKEPEFVEWVFRYTINFIETDVIYKGNNIKVSDLFYQQIITVKDKIETCYTLMHCYIFCDHSYLSQFKKKISLAIAQQERRNRTKKELSSIKLSKKHEQKLKELIQYEKVPKKQLLENLIDNYYNSIKS